ncbi:hypothetical protein ACIQZD_11830 [Peribacillus sp. NPDC096447]|uniref:hypothetical protein n=1 Tax=Peribacillus sp. NPDC096447 TaxID=3364394 RepID=UPI00381FED6E
MNNIQDLIGKKGTITKDFTVIDAKKDVYGVYIRIKERDGEKYWTSLDKDLVLE